MTKSASPRAAFLAPQQPPPIGHRHSHAVLSDLSGHVRLDDEPNLRGEGLAERDRFRLALAGAVLPQVFPHFGHSRKPPRPAIYQIDKANLRMADADSSASPTTGD